MSVRIFGILLLFWFGSCSLSHKQKTAPIKGIDSSQNTTFFVPIPITKFSSIQSPCINIDISGKMFSLELDTGFRGDLSIAQNLTDQIVPKKFICNKPRYGIRGISYPTNFYRIPNITIGAMSFSKPILQEDHSEFIKDSVWVENGEDPSPSEAGRLGWELFYTVNLLIDIKNSKIAFCDSLDTLKKQGYAVETFVRVPLFLEQGLVEFEATTPKGTLLCMLDTGSTYNILNAEIEETQSLEQAMWEPKNRLSYSFFQIQEHDFGAINFRRIPIKIPVRIDAILGMEFFRDHLVFLDFSEKYVYIAKTL